MSGTDGERGALRWLTPDWPVPASVRALSTLRGGGASVAPYDSLNLGDHVGDDAGAVAVNRRRLNLAATLPAEPQWLTQVHGILVRDLDRAGSTTPSDAVVTGSIGAVCAILTADCLPILFATETGDRIGAAHAGWRGLAAGVIEATVAAMARAPGQMLAWLGPAIGPRRFEVGAEVREALLRGDPGAETAFVRSHGDRFLADLFQLARRRLRAAGVERIFGGDECTHSHADRYFSHRRDGRCGRQATLIWLESPSLR